MTRDEAREFAKVVQAYADEKVIQCRLIGDWAWTDSYPGGETMFDCQHYAYRIKAEPREWWIVVDSHDDISAIYHGCSAKKDARDSAIYKNGGNGPYAPYIVAHVREVTP